MKCALLLFAFVAICYSLPTSSGRNVNVSEDGTIVITEPSGKRIVISKGYGVSGQKTVDISVSGPNIPTKRIQINEQNQIKSQGEYGGIDEESLRDKRSSKKQRSQEDVLVKILSGYQGDIDQITYQRLLNEINNAVQEGQLNSTIYDVLQSLNQGQEQGVILGRPSILGGQRQSTILDLLREKAVQDELERLEEGQQIGQLLQTQQGWGLPVVVQGQQTGQVSQVVNVPVGVTQQGTPIVERILLQKTIVSPGLVSGIRGTGLPRQQGPQVLNVPVGVTQQGVPAIQGVLLQGQQIPVPTGTSGVVTTLRGTGIEGQVLGGLTGVTTTVPMGNVWTSGSLASSQGINQQLGPVEQSMSNQLSQVIQQERAILNQQQQEQLLEQQLLQQQQSPQQQLVQQLLQQQQPLMQQSRQQQLLQLLQQQTPLEQQIRQEQLIQQLQQEQPLLQQIGQQSLIQQLQQQQPLVQQIGQQQLTQQWQQQQQPLVQKVLQQQWQQQQPLVQQIRQQQLAQQWQQSPQQQLIQQLQQQQWQPQTWGQQNGQWQVSQPLTLTDLLTSGRAMTTTRGQQSLWQQQPGVTSQGGLTGGVGQGLPGIQRIPIVL